MHFHDFLRHKHNFSLVMACTNSSIFMRKWHCEVGVGFMNEWNSGASRGNVLLMLIAILRRSHRYTIYVHVFTASFFRNKFHSANSMHHKSALKENFPWNLLREKKEQWKYERERMLYSHHSLFNIHHYKNQQTVHICWLTYHREGWIHIQHQRQWFLRSDHQQLAHSQFHLVYQLPWSWSVPIHVDRTWMMSHLLFPASPPHLFPSSLWEPPFLRTYWSILSYRHLAEVNSLELSLYPIIYKKRKNI